jgi:hypothetical protein
VSDDRDIDPLSPGPELLDGRGAKGVGGGDDDLLPLLLKRAGELRDARGLAGSVHAYDEDDRGRRDFLARREKRAQSWGAIEDLDQFLFQCGADFVGPLEALLTLALTHGGEDFLGGGQAGVASDEDFLQFLPEFVVDLAPLKDAADAAEEAPPGTLEGGLGLLV